MADLDKLPPPRISVPITAEIIDEVIDAVASGSTLKTACGRPGHPRPYSVSQVMRSDPELLARYDAARAEGKPLRKSAPGVSVTDAILADCIEALSAGRTLTDFCNEPDRPTRRSIVAAVAKSKHWCQRFTLAREVGFDAMAEEVIRLADAPIPCDDQGRLDRGAVGQRRLQCDVRMKILSKWATARYGDKLQVDGGGAINIAVVTGVGDGGSQLDLSRLKAIAHEPPPQIEAISHKTDEEPV